jgi:uncharacterized membrane protein YeaQ/YmgE (transglycosylase-associated protein family)
VILLFILVWGMFAGWIAHLLLARNQPVNWAELLVVGLAGSFVGGRHPRPVEVTGPPEPSHRLASSGTPWRPDPEHLRVAWQATDLWQRRAQPWP